MERGDASVLEKRGGLQTGRRRKIRAPRRNPVFKQARDGGTEAARGRPGCDRARANEGEQATS